MIKKIRHIGILSPDFEDDLKLFEGFGFACTEVIEREEDGIKIAFFPVGDTFLEFISFDPHKKLRPFHENLKKQPGRINHICFEVDDIEEAIERFKEKGAKLMEGLPRPGAHGLVAFFEPATTGGVLIELCQVSHGVNV